MDNMLSALSFCLIFLCSLPLTPCSSSTWQYFPDPEPLTTPYHAELLCSLSTASGLGGLSVARDDPCKHSPLPRFPSISSTLIASVSLPCPDCPHHISTISRLSSYPLHRLCSQCAWPSRTSRPVPIPTWTRSLFWFPLSRKRRSARTIQPYHSARCQCASVLYP